MPKAFGEPVWGLDDSPIRKAHKMVEQLHNDLSKIRCERHGNVPDNVPDCVAVSPADLEILKQAYPAYKDPEWYYSQPSYLSWERSYVQPYPTLLGLRLVELPVDRPTPYNGRVDRIVHYAGGPLGGKVAVVANAVGPFVQVAAQNDWESTAFDIETYHLIPKYDGTFEGRWQNPVSSLRTQIKKLEKEVAQLKGDNAVLVGELSLARPVVEAVDTLRRRWQM